MIKLFVCTHIVHMTLKFLVFFFMLGGKALFSNRKAIAGYLAFVGCANILLNIQKLFLGKIHNLVAGGGET